MTAQPLAITPARSALLVMHYQTAIMDLFPSVAPRLLANTRQLCDAARRAGVRVHFAKIHFSPGYPEVSPRNKNGQGIDTPIMVGVASTGVMLSSIAHASDADYRLLTVKDCCYDPDPVVHDHLFATAFESRTTVLSLDDALSLLATTARPGLPPNE